MSTRTHRERGVLPPRQGPKRERARNTTANVAERRDDEVAGLGEQPRTRVSEDEHKSPARMAQKVSQCALHKNKPDTWGPKEQAESLPGD